MHFIRFCKMIRTFLLLKEEINLLSKHLPCIELRQILHFPCLCSKMSPHYRLCNRSPILRKNHNLRRKDLSFSLLLRNFSANAEILLPWGSTPPTVCVAVAALLASESCGKNNSSSDGVISCRSMSITGFLCRPITLLKKSVIPQDCCCCWDWLSPLLMTVRLNLGTLTPAGFLHDRTNFWYGH